VTTWTQIDSLDAPTAGVFDFPSLTLTGYTAIQIVASGVTVTTDGTDPRLTFYVAAAEIVTGYRWGMQSASSGAAGNDDGAPADANIRLCSNDANWDVGNAAGEAFGCVITVDDPLSTALYKKAFWEVAYTGPTGVTITANGGGIMENAGAIDGLKLSGSSNLTAGKVRVLGLA
jgi:hypothetical protein